jgi:hypothetical protein
VTCFFFVTSKIASLVQNFLVCVTPLIMMHHTSLLGKDAYCIGTVIAPPLPKDGLCIDFDSTCFDASLSSDLICDKCKALIGVHEHFDLSWDSLSEKMAAIKES